ncbi:MAG: hypothetical protein H0V41_16855 [Pseudonocardiales bacterium]|nr:hypothetical protein [Pseudonocardiales bacterium]
MNGIRAPIWRPRSLAWPPNAEPLALGKIVARQATTDDAGTVRALTAAAMPA